MTSLLKLYALAVATLLTSVLWSGTSAQTLDDELLHDVIVSKEGAVYLFRIDGPVQNGVSVTVLNSLNRVLDLAKLDDSIGAIVITGTGEYFSDTAGGGRGPAAPNGMTQSLYALKTFDRLAHYPMPIIAAINGKAGQGGLELAMSADIRIASDVSSYSQWETLVGLIPGFGGIQKLTALVGPSIATDMMITGRILNAEEALKFGLVSRISPDELLLEDALVLANELVETSPTPALTMLKSRIADSRDQTYSQAQSKDHVEFDKMLASPEFQEALKKFMDRAATK